MSGPGDDRRDDELGAPSPIEPASGPSAVRLAVGILGAAAVAALSAVIVGDYEVSETSAVMAAAVMGLIVAEVAAAATGTRRPPVLAAAVVLSAISAAWERWIASSGGVVPLTWVSYVAPAAAALAAWLSLRSSGRATAGSRSEPAPGDE